MTKKKVQRENKLSIQKTIWANSGAPEWVSSSCSTSGTRRAYCIQCEEGGIV